jgi:tetratricopeptide (TPR) repeat protein
MLADAAVRERDEAALPEYAGKLERLARRSKHILYHAIAQRAWGVAHMLSGNYPEAAQRLGQAHELFTSLGTQWQTARTLHDLAELALLQNNAALARDYYSRALEAFVRMQATPDATFTRKRLQELPV